MYLSYRYTLQEKKNALEEEAGYIARLTAQVLDQEAQLTDSDYLACLSVISGIAGSDPAGVLPGWRGAVQLPDQ